MPDYTTRAVNRLLRGYDNLQHRKSVYGRGLDTLCELADLEREIVFLDDADYNVAVIHGIERTTFRDLEDILYEDKETLRRRYDVAVKKLVDLLNGDE